MRDFLTVVKVPAIIGTIGGISCIIVSQGGEPFYPLVYMMYHGGALIMLFLLLTGCHKLDLGFRRTLSRLIVFLCIPYCSIALISFFVEQLKPHPLIEGDFKDLLMLTGILAGTSLTVSIVGAYFYGLIRLLRKNRQERVVTGAIRRHLEARRKVTGEW